VSRPHAHAGGGPPPAPIPPPAPSGPGGAGGAANGAAGPSSAAAAAAAPPPSSLSSSSVSHRRAAALATIKGPFPPPSHVLSADEQRFIALDCEMVGVGHEGKRSALAEVVLVDWAGRVLYHTHVAPLEPVTDYRTHVSGVRPEHLRGAPSFKAVQAEVEARVRGKVVVGHGLVNDMKALLLSHPWRATRDTALFKPLVRKTRTGHVKPRRLKLLAEQHLGAAIQTGEHEPAEDARAALALYKYFRQDWEHDVSKAGEGGRDGGREREREGRGSGQAGGDGGGEGGDGDDPRPPKHQRGHMLKHGNGGKKRR
jgi:DNA polymerase III epsilon subunit-like protein